MTPVIEVYNPTDHNLKQSKFIFCLLRILLHVECFGLACSV